MAYVTPRKGDRWEIREAVSTEEGPRSRTLASFRELTPDVVEHARERARHPLTADELRRAARRAGAPVALPAADEAAAILLDELAAGREPRPALARALAEALPRPRPRARASDAQRAVAPWIRASLEERGEALRDLLLLADRIPPRRRRRGPRFPRVAT